MINRAIAPCRIALIVLAAGLVGCAAAPSKVDPFEPMNRGLYAVHDALDTAIMRPVAETYVKTVPALIRTGVSNFFNNLDDFISIFNDALQGKPEKWGNDMGRVMLNTGFGLGGIFDLASQAGIERGDEDFGQTFGVWGFPQGPFLFIPVLGPTTFRDGTGWIVRWYASPLHYIDDDAARWSLYVLGGVDTRARLLDATTLVEQAALDKYTFIRNAYLQRRRYLVYDGQPPPEPEEE